MVIRMYGMRSCHKLYVLYTIDDVYANESYLYSGCWGMSNAQSLAIMKSAKNSTG